MAYTENEIQKVWEKGKTLGIDYKHHNLWRKDECGAWIKRDEYGNRDSKYGWEIDHISPGGDDILSNLRPLHWKNNVDKKDGRLKCNVYSEGDQNIGV